MTHVWAVTEDLIHEMSKEWERADENGVCSVVPW